MKDKVIIITAASSGMGLAIARECAQKGAKIALLSRRDEIHSIAKELGGVAVQGSVTEKQDLEKLVKLTLSEYGAIDAVVNNTGHPAKGELLEIPDEDWHNALDLVLLNVHHMAQLVVPVMKEKGGGSFVNISSFAALEPNRAFPVSSVIRAALANYVKLFSNEHGPENIRMNNLLPGFIDSYPSDDKTIEQIPLKRLGTVNEVAQTTLFLLSEESSYITGENIKIDGGLSQSFA